MPVPAIELVRGPATESIRKDWKNATGPFNALASAIKSAPGCVDVYYGQHIEEKDNFILAIVWETVEHHLNFVKTPAYQKVQQAVKPVTNGPVEITHIRPALSLASILDAPVTEFATVSVKASWDKNKTEQLTDFVVREGPGQAGIAATWGTSVEKDNDLWIIIGWNSVEEHVKAVSAPDSPNAADLLTQLRALADIKVAHTSFTKYK